MKSFGSKQRCGSDACDFSATFRSRLCPFDGECNVSAVCAKPDLLLRELCRVCDVLNRYLMSLFCLQANFACSERCAAGSVVLGNGSRREAAKVVSF